MEETKFRSAYALSDNLLSSSGQVFLTGTQALVRLPLMQKALDAARGLNTAGFISGYRGSPLGMVDQALWQAQKILNQHQIRFLPAINEELGATAVLGSQQVETDPERSVDGIFAYWYGKGPGVDRAADALKHGNAFGSSPPATTTAACPRRCRIKATSRSRPGAYPPCRPPAWPNTWSSACTAGRCRALAAHGLD
jgi:hypothetical protein